MVLKPPPSARANTMRLSAHVSFAIEAETTSVALLSPRASPAVPDKNGTEGKLRFDFGSAPVQPASRAAVKQRHKIACRESMALNPKAAIPRR